MAQFVPVKLDVKSDEYQQWRREHQSEGNSIPKLFVVRADGETLYGKSGSLRGDALPAMLSEALSKSGRILSAAEAEAITVAADTFAELKAEGDIQRAIKALSRVKKIGVAGQIESYADPASRLNQLVGEMYTEVTSELTELGGEIEDGEAEAKVAAMLRFLELRRSYTALAVLKSDLSAFQKELTSNRDYSPLYRQVKIIDVARIAKSASSKARNVEKLQKLIADSEVEAIKELARATLDSMATE